MAGTAIKKDDDEGGGRTAQLRSVAVAYRHASKGRLPPNNASVANIALPTTVPSYRTFSMVASYPIFTDPPSSLPFPSLL